MPHCYMLTICSGSSVDQHTNNVTLFNLVEQLNVPPGAPPPPGGVVPLEIHAYFQLDTTEMGQSFDMRFALVPGSGLETYSEITSHRSVTPRYRTRSVGLPFPPVMGQYSLRVDTRPAGANGWTRDTTAWPLLIIEHTPQPVVTH